MMADVDHLVAIAAAERRPQCVMSASIHIHRSTRRVMGITWFSFFVIIVALLVSQDDRASALSDEPAAAGLERGKMIGDSITADDLYEAYQEIQSDYHRKAFSSNQPWNILNQKEGVEVAMLQSDTDPNCPYVRMTAVIPASVKHCWDFLQLDRWEETMPKMDPFYEGVTILGNYIKRGVEIVLARKRTKKILAFGKRDFVFISVSDHPLPDGTWVSGTVSVVSPRIPREKGYTRAFQDSIAYYKPLSNDETKITIVCRIDLNDSAADGSGGSIPMWLYVKTIGATGARSVISMRRALEAEEEDLRLEEELEHEHEGMRFSVPWQVPVFPRDERSILKKKEERQRRKEKQKHDEEGMRFSLPWQVPVLPHDETKKARKVRGGKNDEPKRRLPWVHKVRSDKKGGKKQHVQHGTKVQRGGNQDDNHVVERIAWFRPFDGIFRGKKGGP